MVRSQVNPYRAHELRRPTHALGSDRARRLKVLGGFAVIVANVALFLWVASNATHVNVIFFGPAVFGALLLVQARAGSIVLHPEERAGEIVVRRVIGATRTRFGYGDVTGTSVSRVVFMGSPADYELRLGLSGDRTIPLLRGNASELETAQAGVNAFLDENGLPERHPG